MPVYPGAPTLPSADRDQTLRIATPSLPTPVTSFVGQVAERAELAEVVTQHRLVTAVGPGSVGKTRLAVAVAAEVTETSAKERTVHDAKRSESSDLRTLPVNERFCSTRTQGLGGGC